MIQHSSSDSETVVTMTDPILSIDCSPDGIHCICSQGMYVKVYDLKSFEEIGFSMRGNLDKVRIVKYSPNGDLIASAVWGKKKNKLFIWDSKTRLLIQKLTVSRESIFCLSFSPDGQYLAAGNADNSIRLTNLSSRLELKQPKDLVNEDQNWVTDIQYSPNGSKLVSCGSSKTIQIWDLRNFKCKKINQHDKFLSSVRYINRQVLFSSSGDGTSKVWLEKNGKLIRRFLAHLPDIDLSPDRKLLAGGEKGKVLLKDLATNKTLAELNLQSDYRIQCLLFSKDGRSIISVTHNLRITNIETYMNHKI